MIGKEIEGTGIGKEKKKMRGVEGAIVTTTRKEVMTGKKSESDRESGPRSGEVGARRKKKNIKKTKMIGGTGMTRKIPKKRENTVGAEAEKGSIGVGVEVGMQGNGVEAEAKRNPESTRAKARRSPLSEVGVAVKGELTVLRRENGSGAPARINPESAAAAKSGPTNGITAKARTSLTNTMSEGAKAQNRRAKKNRKKTRLCEHAL